MLPFTRFKECKTLIEIAALNPSRLDSLVKIYRFYQKGIGKVETSNEGSILEAVFKEYRENSAVILSEADLDTMQQEVPVEILIK